MIIFMRVFCEEIYLVSSSMFGLEWKSDEKEIELLLIHLSRTISSCEGRFEQFGEKHCERHVSGIFTLNFRNTFILIQFQQ